MPTNRSNVSINRTLLILLGIILACLLTLNARSFYSAETLSFPKKFVTPTVDKNVEAGLVKKIGENSFRSFIEKMPSLK